MSESKSFVNDPYPYLSRLLTDDIKTVECLIDRLCGHYAAGKMFRRLLYWWPKAKKKGGWVYKSWRDWEAECNIKRPTVKRMHSENFLEKIGVETALMKANGAPTKHYRLNVDVFLDALATFLGLSRAELTKQMGLSEPMQEVENDQSITESDIHEHTEHVVVGISKGLGQILVSKYGFERVEKVVDYARKQRNITNLPAFVRWELKNNTVEDKVKQPDEDPMRFIRGKWGHLFEH